MDIDTLIKGVGLFSSALAALQTAIAFLPDGSEKEKAMAYLEKAEREFKIAESQVATELKYEICRQHFPPVIMLSKDDENWICPECQNIKKPDDYGNLINFV